MIQEPTTGSRRFDEYYGPIVDWCRQGVERCHRRPFFLGISGPQGSGKSTLAQEIVSSLAGMDLRGVALSIDDFYLSYSEQCALASQYPGERALEFRGNAGTHDVALGCDVLGSLGAGRATALPSYDKSAHEGRGDRRRSSSWTVLEPPLDLVILEGWMLGFTPVETSAIEPGMTVPNQRLGAYQAWHAFLDAFLLLDASSLDDIVRWRIDAERARRERGETALSDADARDYIERFLPAYRMYVPPLRASTAFSRRLTVRLGPDRHPIAPVSVS